jgi:hypothetical protein
MPFAGLAKKQLVLRSGALVVAAVSMAVGCQLIVTLDGSTEQSSPLDASRPDGASEGGETLQCGPRPLGPPDAEVHPGNTGRNYFYVIVPSTTPNDVGLGFDLDCIDTRCTEGSPKLGCRPAGNLTYCDLPNGVDDQLTLASGRRGLSRNPKDYIERVQAGHDGIMFAILGYHGDASDSVVGFSTFRTSGIRMPADCGAAAEADADPDADADAEPSPGPTPDDGGFFRAVGNGCDFFSVDSRYAQGGTPLAVVQGYVNGDMVVVQSPMPMWLPYGDRLIEAEVDYIQAKRTVLDDGGPLHLVGVMSGRLSPLAILRALGEERASDDAALCNSSGWEAVRTALCQELDLASANAVSVDEPCGAMSFSVPFDGFLAKLNDQAAANEDPPSECHFDVDASAICPQ